MLLNSRLSTSSPCTRFGLKFCLSLSSLRMIDDVLSILTLPRTTAEWTGQQILQGFPFDTAPRYLLRDRDRIYGQEFRNQVAVMNIKEVLSAPRSPWQRAYV